MTDVTGAVLTTASTLGFTDAADLGPTSGSGFEQQWHLDLAALRERGVTDVRLTLDWARLQPGPGSFDPRWSEWYGHVVDTAGELGMKSWLCLHESAVPRWFDNEGGLADGEAFIRRWPHWVERVADHFGDRADGWVPFARLPPTGPARPWHDTWGILGGGGRPVVAAVDIHPGFRQVETLVAVSDAIGVDLSGVDTRFDDGELHPDELAGALHDIAGQAGAAPLMITAVADDSRAREALDAVIADGLAVGVVFVEPVAQVLPR